MEIGQIFNEIDKKEKEVQELKKQIEKESILVTVLFADLVGSTSYKESRGFSLGIKKSKRHNEIITNIVKEQGGTVIKELGDGILITFIDPREAVESSKLIQEELMRVNNKIEDELDYIVTKIGINYGRVVLDNGDPQGSIVDIAARITSIAKPYQTLITETVFELVKQFKWLTFSKSIGIKLKGITSATNIREVLWSRNELGISQDILANNENVQDNIKELKNKIELPNQNQLILEIKQIQENSNNFEDFESILKFITRDQCLILSVLKSLGMDKILEEDIIKTFQYQFFYKDYTQIIRDIEVLQKHKLIIAEPGMRFRNLTPHGNKFLLFLEGKMMEV
ncbi:MAG: adenylate/guanylate cyclase domain-containing protein [Saprospiraceae bacterium]|nr:adenylate/guanylate cyclase domain-containing protein [Saprospiraceae bacterium]